MVTHYSGSLSSRSAKLLVDLRAGGEGSHQTTERVERRRQVSRRTTGSGERRRSVRGRPPGYPGAGQGVGVPLPRAGGRPVDRAVADSGQRKIPAAHLNPSENDTRREQSQMYARTLSQRKKTRIVKSRQLRLTNSVASTMIDAWMRRRGHRLEDRGTRGRVSKPLWL